MKLNIDHSLSPMIVVLIGVTFNNGCSYSWLPGCSPVQVDIAKWRIKPWLPVYKAYTQLDYLSGTRVNIFLFFFSYSFIIAHFCECLYFIPIMLLHFPFSSISDHKSSEFGLLNIIANPFTTHYFLCHYPSKSKSFSL